MSHPKEWHEERKKNVGASEVAAVLGISPYTSPFEVWAVKTGTLEPFAGNDATRLGQRLEPLILDEAESDLGTLRRDVAVQHPKVPLRATLDGQSVESGQVIECKTSGFSWRVDPDWGDDGLVEVEGQVPAYVYVQVQAQLLCTGSELAHIYAWLAGRGIMRYQVVPDESLQEQIEQRVSDWWQKHMVLDEAPPMSGTPLKVLSRLDRSDKTVELPEDVVELLDRREVEKIAVSSATAKMREIDTAIVERLGDAECGVLPNGTQISYRQTTRKGYEVKETTYRTLRIKKAKQ